MLNRNEKLTQSTAVEAQLKNEGIDPSTYLKEVAKNPDLSLFRRRDLASRHTKSSIIWSCDVPRTREGFYHYRAGFPAATKRAIQFGPYADLLWLETATPSVAHATKFAGVIRQHLPEKKLVYNLSPSFNWMGQGFDEGSLKSFIWDLAKNG